MHTITMHASVQARQGKTLSCLNGSMHLALSCLNGSMHGNRASEATALALEEKERDLASLELLYIYIERERERERSKNNKMRFAYRGRFPLWQFFPGVLAVLVS